MRRTSIVLAGALILTPALGTALALVPMSPAAETPQTRPTASPYAGLTCFTVLVHDSPPLLAQLRGTRESARLSASAGDVVYVDNGGMQLQEGTSYQIFRIEGPVDHPNDASSLGFALNLVGFLEVLEVGSEYSVARVSDNCLEIEVGDWLRLPPEQDVTIGGEAPAFDSAMLIRPSANDGTVVFGTSETVATETTPIERAGLTPRRTYGTGDVVTVDRGTADGWDVDMAVVIYRERAMPDDPADYEQEQPVPIANAVVFWAQPNTSSLIILAGDQPVELGLSVQPLGR